MKEFEYKNVVYDVTNGPKVMIDNLNTNGKEGWQIGTSIVIGQILVSINMVLLQIIIHLDSIDSLQECDGLGEKSSQKIIHLKIMGSA